MTYKEVEELQKKINEIEEFLQTVRDESSLETKKAINEALGNVQALYDTTHKMDSSIRANGC